MPVSKPSKPSKKTKPVKPAKPAPATAPLENPGDAQSAPVLPEPANPTVPQEVLLGDGEGAAFNPLALALSAAAAKHTTTQWPITFAEPDAVEESAGVSCPVLVIHAASWHGLFDSVPMHLRSLETAGLFEEYERKEGGQHPTGFMTGMMTSLGEIEAPAEAEKQARRHEKLVAFGRQLDAMMGPTLEQMPGAPPRIARIPTEKLPTALYLLAVNRCNREGLGVLAARLQIDVNDRDALLQRGPATSIELVVLLRLLAGDVEAKPWLTFTLGRHRYATTAGVTGPWMSTVENIAFSSQPPNSASTACDSLGSDSTSSLSCCRIAFNGCRLCSESFGTATQSVTCGPMRNRHMITTCMLDANLQSDRGGSRSLAASKPAAG